VEDHVRDPNALGRRNIDLGPQSVIDDDIFLSDDVKRLIRIDDDGRGLVDSNPQQFGILGDQTDEPVMSFSRGEMLIDNRRLDETETRGRDNDARL
jgi:hypothetical protein